MKSDSVIKIFVSSTFKDMDLERDILRNYVQPQLNQKLTEYNIRVELVDLRHSIYTDSNYTEAQREKFIFDICIDEINSCKPYFIGFIGYRYGWIPPENLTADKNVTLDSDFPLNRNELSVTVHEFLHGVWNDSNGNHAFVFLKNMDSYDTLKDDDKKTYIDYSDNYERINLLREYARKNSHGVEVVEYSLNPETKSSEEWENWANDIIKRLINRIKQDIGDNQTSIKLLPFFRMQQNFIANRISRFEGRKEFLDECTASLKDREALYLYQDFDGMGSTSLLCMVYSRLKEDDNYFCLFNSTEIGPHFRIWTNVLYHWNLQLAQFLGDNYAELEKSRNNEALLFQLYCIYCQRIYKEKHRKVAVFIDNAYNMEGFFSLKQPFTLFSTTYPSGNRKIIPIIFPKIVGPLTIEDIKTIARNIRPAIVSDLILRPSAGNVKWLTLAINILENLNKLDYSDIRRSERKGNEEQNITKYLLSIVADMPEAYENLCLFWIERLKSVLGEDFVSTYITAMLNSYGLSDESLAAITGRNTDWCAYFRHLLGSDIISETENGLYIIQQKQRDIFNRYYDDSNSSIVMERLSEYLNTVSHDSPIYINNIFTVNLFKENIAFLASYISNPENYRPNDYQWTSIKALNHISRTEPLQFKRLIDRIINESVPTYALFHYLERWDRQLADMNNGDWISHIRVCKTLINRLTQLDNDGLLSNDTKRALVEILLETGGAAVELEDGEDLWDDCNRQALICARKHLNESASWDALLCEALYDRYEGCRNMQQRWEFLDTDFRPIESLLYHDYKTEKSLYYIRLLRDLAILDCRFLNNTDPVSYCLKALKISYNYLDDTLADSFDEYANNALFCSSCSLKVSSESNCAHSQELLQLVSDVIDKIIPTCDKYTRWTEKIANLGQLIAMYSEFVMGIDVEKAVRIIDRVLDIIVSSETPPEVEIGAGLMSRATIGYMVIRETFGHSSDTTDYFDIGFSWCLSARVMIESYFPGAVAKYSQYPYYNDDFEIVMRLANKSNNKIWIRELDTSFVLLNTIFAKIIQLIKNKEGVDIVEFKRLHDTYMKIYHASEMHYRYNNIRHAAIVHHISTQIINDKTAKNTDNKQTKSYSLEELEQMILSGNYDPIIKSMSNKQSGRPDEVYYFALALLRTGNPSLAGNLFKMLSNQPSLSDGFILSCKINYLFALLVGGDTENFLKYYGELDYETRTDSDVKMLYTALKAISNGEKPELPSEWGFLL